MPEPDPILDRLHHEFPNLFPYHESDHRRYLMDFLPVTMDRSGVLRARLSEFRAALRAEIAGSSLHRPSAPGNDSANAPPPFRSEPAARIKREAAESPWVEHFLFLYDHLATRPGDARVSAKAQFRGASRVEPVSAAVDVDGYFKATVSDFGSCESVCLWAGYPRLGLDRRNQFDYYRQFFGDGDRLGEIVSRFHELGVRVALSYNPWDVGTRGGAEAHADGLRALFVESGADALFLDTLSSINADAIAKLRAAHPSLTLCPELLPSLRDAFELRESWQQFAAPVGFEVPVHRWLVPQLRLRIVDRNARSHGEQIAGGLFFGTGHIVWENIFGWWNPWQTSDRRRIARTSNLLRKLVRYFEFVDWEPFVDCDKSGDYGIQVNRWRYGEVTLFTVRNRGTRSCSVVSVAVAERDIGHYDSMGRYSAEAVDVGSGRKVRVELRANRTLRLHFLLKPGTVRAILLGSGVSESPLIRAMSADGGRPSRHRPVTLRDYRALRPRKLMQDLKSVNKVELEFTNTISTTRHLLHVRRACNDAMEGGTYGDISSATAKAIPDRYVDLRPYRISVHPVTNRQFRAYLLDSGYRPVELIRFLDHWRKPAGTGTDPAAWQIAAGEEDHPVRWVSLEDARAFANWYGWALPTEAQWQYAAEGPERSEWPWGAEYDAARCNGNNISTEPVTQHAEGASWCGCCDLCGNVWEWTESERDDGHTRYAMIRGGSFLVVTGSIWYTAGGPQPCNVHEKVLLRTGGVDRLETVGFRCVTSPNPARHLR